jgi:hypothetical protein
VAIPLLRGPCRSLPVTSLNVATYFAPRGILFLGRGSKEDMLDQEGMKIMEDK